jgi:hypothetical protein
MYKFTALLISILLLGFSLTLAQDAKLMVRPNIVVSGDEVGQSLNNFDLFTSDPVSFGPVNSGSLVWIVNNISDRQSGYDLQSNGSTQQIWYDLNNPGYVHAVFAYSAVDDNVWSDRTSLYFGTIDNGATWFELGGVPVNNGTTGRSGFPSIVGTSTGSAVISNHNNALPLPTTRASVFIDNSPFEYSFTNYDPGTTPNAQGEAIWPILAILDNDEIIVAASQNTPGDSFYVNTLSSGVFSGWQVLDGDQAETYALGTSPGGLVGLVNVGAHVGVDDRDIIYRESADGGLTWSSPETLFDCDETQFPTIVPGGLRGVNVSFYNEEPCAVFEIGGVNSTQYSNGSSEIYFWSPTINGGVAKVIADTNNVPYYPYLGINDVVWSLSRPVIGRSEAPHNYLFVAFQATTGDYWPGTSSADSTSYFCGMFTYSSDGGETWSVPEQFTPVSTPLLDYRHPSIAPVNPVTSTPGNDDVITVHITIQGDPMPGSTANGWNVMPPSVTAQYYHFTTEFTIVGVDDDIIANSFNLEQNYPNPFNPSTTINYTLAERSAITLKVYDVLGNEVASLVNTTQEAGKYNVKFDASKLSSGLYIYTLNAGNYTSSRKMMLLK